MKHYILGIIFTLQLFSVAVAGEESIREFAQDLEKLFSLESKRTLEIGDVTHFVPQINPNRIAEASYNPLINTIFLKKENIISTGWMSYKVKSLTALKAEQPVTYPVIISTIFHELGHSEMDQFILNGITSEDRILLSIFKYEFTPWVKKNYPGINPKTLFQEIYGYYRGGVIETLFQDKSTIESFNGYNIYQHRCFNSFYLKKMVSTLSREEFGQFIYPKNDPIWEEKYRNKFMPRYVFIQGKDIDLMKNPDDPFKELWKKAFWYYFTTNYHSPSSMRELTIYFQTHHDDRNFIKECRNKLWDGYHSYSTHKQR
jgi:hypothetical protein